jgi:hypothetical protein
MKKELVISRNIDLLELERRARKYHRIRVEVPHFSKEENEKWAALIQKEYKACGCNTGSWFILISLLFSAGFFLLNMSAVLSDIRHYSFMMFLLVVGMALIGKVAGLLAANRKLSILVHILKRRL